MATIQSGASSDFSISWKTIAHETITDPVMKLLLNCVRTGFLECHYEDPSISHFENIEMNDELPCMNLMELYYMTIGLSFPQVYAEVFSVHCMRPIKVCLQ